jgi:hypothetical protein
VLTGSVLSAVLGYLVLHLAAGPGRAPSNPVAVVRDGAAEADA